MASTGKSLIDCHVHLAALPGGDNGCFISPKLLRRPLFRFLLWKRELSPVHPQEANERYLDHLLAELHASRYVSKAVLLGMDGFYDQSGLLNRQQTDFLVGDDYVFKAVCVYPDVFLAGPSINYQREDAIGISAASRIFHFYWSVRLSRPSALCRQPGLLDGHTRRPNSDASTMRSRSDRSKAARQNKRAVLRRRRTALDVPIGTDQETTDLLKYDP